MHALLETVIAEETNHTFTVRHGIQETKHKQSLVILFLTVQCIVEHVQEGPRTTTKLTAVLSLLPLKIMQNNVYNTQCTICKDILLCLSVAKVKGI